MDHDTNTTLCVGCADDGATFEECGVDGYVRCSKCGLVRSGKLPDEETLAVRANYWSEKHQLREERLQRLFDPAVQRVAYGDVLRRLTLYRRTGRLLDVGCAAGGFLDAASRDGWTATGVELSSQAAAYARDVRGLDVRTGTVERAALDENAFDCIVLLDVIEHLLDPGAMLRSVAPLLRPRGALFLLTPNVASLGARWLKEEWEAYAPDDHLWLFDKRTLSSLCVSAGYEVRARWSIDLNPFALAQSIRPRRHGGARAAKAGTSPGTGGKHGRAIARRNQLIAGMKRSPVLRMLRNGVNGVLKPLDLGDKLHLLAERREAPSL